MKKSIFYLLSFVVLLLPAISDAFSFQYSPEINVNDEVIFEDNLYLLGGSVNFNNFFDQDLTVLSGNSQIDGVVFGDLLNIGSNTNLTGEFFGDARIIAGEVNVSGNTNKDLILISGKSFFNSDSIINGKSMIVSVETTVEGKILDDLKIFARSVYLNAEVLGDVEITTQELILGPNANIKGNLVYFSPTRAQIYEGAQLKNTITYNQIESIDENDFVKRTVVSFFTFFSIIKFLATLLIGFILVYVFRVFSQRITDISTNRVGRSLFVGLLSLILIPVVVFILIASLFGIPLALLLLFVVFSVLLISNSVIAIVLGYLIKRKIEKKERVEIDFNSTALGVVVLTFLYFIPIIGTLLKTILTIWILGSIVIYSSEVVLKKKKK